MKHLINAVMVASLIPVMFEGNYVNKEQEPCVTVEWIDGWLVTTMQPCEMRDGYEVQEGPEGKLH